MPSPTPRVSVLITTRNGARTISDSLQSILTQDMPDFELVVAEEAGGAIDRAGTSPSAPVFPE